MKNLSFSFCALIFLLVTLNVVAQTCTNRAIINHDLLLENESIIDYASMDSNHPFQLSSIMKNSKLDNKTQMNFQVKQSENFSLPRNKSFISNDLLMRSGKNYKSHLARVKLKSHYQGNLMEGSFDELLGLNNNFTMSNNSIQSTDKISIMDTNRRLKYSSIWAFTALNYLYADLVGLMDLNLLSQYQTGVVNGVEITPGFLTAAAAYMQLPLANVFLPHVIKNDRILRLVQIISGSIATAVQGATLFVGKPAPYYVLFSAIEMGATAFITYNAIKWKTPKNNKKKPIDF